MVVQFTPSPVETIWRFLPPSKYAPSNRMTKGSAMVCFAPGLVMAMFVSGVAATSAVIAASNFFKLDILIPSTEVRTLRSLEKSE